MKLTFLCRVATKRRARKREIERERERKRGEKRKEKTGDTGDRSEKLSRPKVNGAHVINRYKAKCCCKFLRASVPRTLGADGIEKNCSKS